MEPNVLEFLPPAGTHEVEEEDDAKKLDFLPPTSFNKCNQSRASHKTGLPDFFLAKPTKT
jgi:hypothetical protein